MKYLFYLISYVSLVSLTQCKKKDQQSPLQATLSEESPASLTSKQVENRPEPPQPKPEVIPPSPTLQKELRSAVNRWNELPSQFSGKDLITKQRELVVPPCELDSL